MTREWHISYNYITNSEFILLKLLLTSIQYTFKLLNLSYLLVQARPSSFTCQGTSTSIQQKDLFGFRVKFLPSISIWLH